VPTPEAGRAAGAGEPGKVTAMLEIGAQLPAFVVRDANREEVTDQAFRGAIAVLAFYPMAFTGG
jgi:peroxiredoxin